MIELGRIVIAGHATIDNIHHVDGRDLHGTFGGGAVYASVGAALVGAQVSLVSLVGDDYPIARLREALGPTVDVSGVRALAGRSVHNDAWYGPAGERRWDIESWERMEELTPTAADLDGCAGAFVLLCQSSLWQQRELLARVAAAQARVALDTEIHYLDTPSRREDLLALVANLDVFLPSIEHLELLFGRRDGDPVAYAQELQRLRCGLVAVKHGARGSTVLDFAAGGAGWHIPAVGAVAVVDTTGAGDAYNGGFVAALSAGLPVVDAACWGTVAASFVVETIGAHIPARFDPSLAERRFAELRPQARELSTPAVTAMKEFAT